MEAKVKGVFLTLPNPEKEDLYKVIQDLTEKFLEMSDTDMARKSIRCSFDLIKLSTRAERLKKLDSLGTLMLDIAKNENSSRFTEEYEFMDRILDEMHAVRDEDIEIKCRWISRFCLSYGLCCIAAGTYKKAIEINEKAIFMMKFVFGKEYCQNKSLHRCCHNIGVSYQKLGKVKESIEAFTNAAYFESQFKAFHDELPQNETNQPTRKVAQLL